MNDLEKEVVREKKYEENRRKMYIVKRNLMISRIYNVYVNLAVTLISAASMYIWVSYTSAGIKMVHILAEEVGTISFPWFGATFFIAPILLILSFVSDVFLIRKLSRISQVVYILLCIFTVLEIFLRFEPMKPPIFLFCWFILCLASGLRILPYVLIRKWTCLKMKRAIPNSTICWKRIRTRSM